MIGEQYDIAVAFCKGVILGQRQGKMYRKLLTIEEIKELLRIKNINPIPDKVRDAFTDYSVYVRKLRGKNYYAVWWDEKTNYHGRGVPKSGKMQNM